MLFSFNFKPKSNVSTPSAAQEMKFIKIKSIYYHYIFAVEKHDEEKFFKAAPDDLIACRPISKNGSLQKVRAVLFKRNELQLVMA